MEEMKKNPYVHIIGSDRPEDHHGILAFTVQDVHPHDVAAILDSDKIAVRAGHHCAQPLLAYLKTPYGRRSSALYAEPQNTEKENGVWRVRPFTMRV